MLDATVAEADCVLCRDLDPAARSTMRADLLELPLRDIDNICEACLGAFWTNLQASFPKTEEERLRRREEVARTANDKQANGSIEVGWEGLAIPAFVLTGREPNNRASVAESSVVLPRNEERANGAVQHYPCVGNHAPAVPEVRNGNDGRTN
jgi:hypothetical protein